VSGGAAERDGTVMVGDVIIAVDDREVIGEPLAVLRSLILGQQGSTVKLSLQRREGAGSQATPPRLANPPTLCMCASVRALVCVLCVHVHPCVCARLPVSASIFRVPPCTLMVFCSCCNLKKPPGRAHRLRH
jgi:hypothetical protein